MLARLGLGAKLVLASVVLLALAGFVIERLSSTELERVMIERIEKQLSAELALLEDAARGVDGSATPTEWDAFADRFGRRSGSRVTLIDAEGKVVGDSEVQLAELVQLENHRSREEVALARERGEGTAIRPSPTLHVRMIYAARRFEGATGAVRMLRLAVPLTEVDRAVASGQRIVALGTILAIALAAAVNIAGTLALTRPIRELKAVALSMARGDLDERARVTGSDEAAELGAALNRLATELSASMGELRADHDLLAGILDGMSEGVLVLDHEARIVLANRALRQMTAMSADAIGKPMIEAIRSAGLQQAFDEACKGSVAVLREVEIGGFSTKRVLVRLSPLSGSRRTKRELIAVLHDVTDLRRLETIRTDFVANVSHELRTPITAISTSVETLLQGALGDAAEAKEFVEVIERHAVRLRQLVDDLLDLSKIEAKGFRLKPADLELAPIVESAISLCRESADRRKVRIALERERDLPRARADRQAVEQILSNLLDNALKYAGEGARVEVSLASAGEQILLRVADDGPGIPAAHVDRIFERFYRVDPGRSRDLGGTGLGLSIVKHLVELMGGTIGVESAPGNGTAFLVRLPRAT